MSQPIRSSEDFCGLPFPTPQRHRYKRKAGEVGKPNDNGQRRGSTDGRKLPVLHEFHKSPRTGLGMTSPLFSALLGYLCGLCAKNLANPVKKAFTPYVQIRVKLFLTGLQPSATRRGIFLSHRRQMAFLRHTEFSAQVFVSPCVPTNRSFLPFGMKLVKRAIDDS